MTTDPTDPLHRFGEVRRELEARWPESQISPTLDRIRTLTQFLGDPQRAYPVIHVTGTNGKTSTARMIESLLRAFGLHTGLITSPHLSDLRERIRLDGEPISIDAFLDIYDEVAPVLAMADEASELEGGPRLSFFEVMTGLAFAAFADAPVDVAVVEVGMGGTWDATNVADGQVAVIMPIGMDHSDYLGDTLADIAGEKAGIIKPTSSVVLAAQDDEAMEVLAAAASADGGAHGRRGDPLRGARATGRRRRAAGHAARAGRGLRGGLPPAVRRPPGAQRGRCARGRRVVLRDHVVPGRADWRPTRRIRAGAASPIDIRESGAGRGRRHRHPRAHGRPAPGPRGGARRVSRRSPRRAGSRSCAGRPRWSSTPRTTCRARRRWPRPSRTRSRSPRRSAVVGILADKDAAGILAALDPVVDRVVITRSSSPRALPVAELAAIAAEVLGEERVEAVERLDDALERAIELAEAGSPAGVGAGVIVTGSVTMAGEARLLLGAESGHESGATRSEHGAPRGRAPEGWE